MSTTGDEGLVAWLARWSAGWRGPILAALLALLAGLPGLLAMPPLDRDESRFAQATAQMLEQEDYVVIRFQDQPRFKKPVGIHWLQAASVAAVSDPDARQIWAYRLPSLIGAMLAAGACAWGAAVFFGSSTGLIAGAILGSGLLLSTEAFIAKTDAVLCGTTTLALACLAKIYADQLDGKASGRLTRLVFWLAISVATLVKGPIGPMAVILTVVGLSIWDRKGKWITTLGWGWGVILFIAIVGPWAWAVTVATDGGFWKAAIIGDLAPKLSGSQESHGAPFGYHSLAAIIQTFPATLLLPAAVVMSWRRRAEPGVRFALCWLVPTWLIFEMTPTKLSHYALPCYGALAWLAAAALREPLGAGVRWIGAGMQALVGLLLAIGTAYLMNLYGDRQDLLAAVLTGLAFAAAGGVGAYCILKRQPLRALVWALPLGILAHSVLVGGLLPHLEPILLSKRIEAVLAKAQLLPRQGTAPGPIAVAGYAEPSLVFAIGTGTDLGDAKDAAEALADHRAAVVEDREQPAFQATVKTLGVRPRLIGSVKGLDYSNGDEMILSVYAPAAEVPVEPQP